MTQVKMESITNNQMERNFTLELIIEGIKSFSMIEKAWVYGSLLPEAMTDQKAI